VPIDENIVTNPGAYQTVPRKKDTTSLQKNPGAYSKLNNGQDFSAVSAAYTLEPSGPSVPRIAGDLGYITVFSLPYELEKHHLCITDGRLLQTVSEQSRLSYL
jgi:hypothetical protein